MNLFSVFVAGLTFMWRASVALEREPAPPSSVYIPARQGDLELSSFPQPLEKSEKSSLESTSKTNKEEVTPLTKKRWPRRLFWVKGSSPKPVSTTTPVPDSGRFAYLEGIRNALESRRTGQLRPFEYLDAIRSRLQSQKVEEAVRLSLFEYLLALFSPPPPPPSTMKPPAEAEDDGPEYEDTNSTSEDNYYDADEKWIKEIMEAQKDFDDVADSNATAPHPDAAKEPDHKPEEAKPGDDKPADRKPDEVKVNDAKSKDKEPLKKGSKSESREQGVKEPEEAKPGNDKSANRKPDEVKLDNAKSKDKEPLKEKDSKSESREQEVKEPEKAKPGNDEPAERKPDESKLDNAKPKDKEALKEKDYKSESRKQDFKEPEDIMSKTKEPQHDLKPDDKLKTPDNSSKSESKAIDQSLPSNDPITIESSGIPLATSKEVEDSVAHLKKVISNSRDEKVRNPMERQIFPGNLGYGGIGGLFDPMLIITMLYQGVSQAGSQLIDAALNDPHFQAKLQEAKKRKQQVQQEPLQRRENFAENNELNLKFQDSVETVMRELGREIEQKQTFGQNSVTLEDKQKKIPLKLTGSSTSNNQLASYSGGDKFEHSVDGKSEAYQVEKRQGHAIKTAMTGEPHSKRKQKFQQEPLQRRENFAESNELNLKFQDSIETVMRELGREIDQKLTFGQNSVTFEDKLKKLPSKLTGSSTSNNQLDSYPGGDRFDHSIYGQSGTNQLGKRQIGEIQRDVSLPTTGRKLKGPIAPKLPAFWFKR